MAVTIWLMRLKDVPPRDAVAYLRNGVMLHAESSTDRAKRFGAGTKALTDIPDVGLGKSTLWRLLAPGHRSGVSSGVVAITTGHALGMSSRSVPVAAGKIGSLHNTVGPAAPLRLHVSKVVEISSEEQVVGADAKRHIAAMANVHAVRNSAVVEFPRKTVCADDLRSDAYGAVSATLKRCTGPQPASGRFVDPSPETIKQVRPRPAHFRRNVLRIRGVLPPCRLPLSIKTLAAFLAPARLMKRCAAGAHAAFSSAVNALDDARWLGPVGTWRKPHIAMVRSLT